MMHGSSDATLKELLEGMKDDVEVLLFTSLVADGYRQCPACEDTASLMKDLSVIAPKIKVSEFSTADEKDKQVCKKYNVTRAPTIIIPAFNIRYTGAPIGLEMAPFIQTLIMASTSETPMGELMVDALAGIKKGEIMVIVTPTCPYCAHAVLLVNSMAIATSGKISVEVVESYENPDIAREWEVTGVPVTIVNREEKITGVPNFQLLVSKLQDNKKKFDQIYG